MATSLTQPRSPTKRRNHSVARARVASDSPRCKIILGIDPGLERTGYGVLATTQGRVIDAGLLRSSTRSPLPERLHDLAAGLEEVIAEHSPDLMAVEDLYAHYKHPRTAILMGHVRGVLLYIAAKNGIDVLNLASTRVKRFLTGNGHASKVQMQRAIMTTLSLPRLPEPPDARRRLGGSMVRLSELSPVKRVRWSHDRPSAGTLSKSTRTARCPRSRQPGLRGPGPGVRA
jgi:crossover junction endodeoxyribonuclease RuvC